MGHICNIIYLFICNFLHIYFIHLLLLIYLFIYMYLYMYLHILYMIYLYLYTCKFVNFSRSSQTTPSSKWR